MAEGLVKEDLKGKNPQTTDQQRIVHETSFIAQKSDYFGQYN